MRPDLQRHLLAVHLLLLLLRGIVRNLTLLVLLGVCGTGVHHVANEALDTSTGSNDVRKELSPAFGAFMSL